MKNGKNFYILIVDDEIEYCTSFSYILSDAGYDVSISQSGEEALGLLEKKKIDLVLTDMKMNGMDGLELTCRIKENWPEIQVMLITAFGTVESAVSAMKNGASGYFIKGSDPEALLMEIAKFEELKKLKQSNVVLKRTANKEAFLQSKSEKFGNVLSICEKVASSDVNVLLLGESGVGKEVIANYIHNLSNRRDENFVAVNCQAFSDGLVESELFGHEKGAFTGASSQRIGRFEEADMGTLFLDEIGDLPAGTQSKLLRSLETHSIERIGSNKTIALDFRLISATNKNLMDAVKEGTFREDLFYRLNTISVVIPPLRERREDLPGLINYFIKRISGEQKKVIKTISPEIKKFLLEYDYPGNVRELRNILERLVVLSEDGYIGSSGALLNIPSKGHDITCNIDNNLPLRKARAEFEKEYIEEILRKNNGNMDKTAEALAITKRQLWNKISEYNIEH